MLFQRNRFRFHSPLNRKEAKVALRGILDKAPGSPSHIWGMSIGSFVWMNLSMSYPMQTAYVRLESDLSGTTVSGFRGVSVAIYLFLLVCIAIAGWRLFTLDEVDGFWLLLLFSALVVVAAIADHYWHDRSALIEHKLRAALGAHTGSSMAGAANLPLDLAALNNEVRAVSQTPVPSSTLVLGGEEEITPVSESDILRSISSMDEGSFLILSFADQEYIQAAMDCGRLVLERREGDAESHFIAAPTLDGKNVLAAFLSFLNRAEMPQDIAWEQVRV